MKPDSVLPPPEPCDSLAAIKADEPIAGQAPPANSADELSRLLEIELIQKRAAWQRTLARNKSLKSLSLLFLCLVVLAGMGSFYFVYFVYMNASEGRQQRPATALDHGNH
jgi:hypothetical protein